MAGATALLVISAGITTQLLRLVGLLFAGGVLLLWVCWKMWRELRATANQEEEEAVEILTGLDINAGLRRSDARRRYHRRAPRLPYNLLKVFLPPTISYRPPIVVLGCFNEDTSASADAGFC
jgi:hypothetical protein